MTSTTMMNAKARGFFQGLSPGVRLQHVIVSIVFALTMLTPWAVSAAETPRIAVVQTERILREAAPAKAAQTKLEQEFGKRDKELQELGAKLKAA
ncbi:MAG: OmpH family outer membrane protein, partial [Betaproteobacteria bacterium]